MRVKDMIFSIREEWQLLESAHPVDEYRPGVYFLFKDGKVVYVGKSLNTIARIYDHQRARSKDFDAYTILPVAAEYLDELEVEYICKFTPKYNSLLPKNKIYANMRQLKEMFGLSGPQIKKIIKKKCIHGDNFCGGTFYKISEFGDTE